LVLVDRDAAALTASKLKCEEAGAAAVLCLTVDVTDYAAVQAMQAAAIERFKVLDVLVLCAGIGAHHLFDATPDLAIFRKLMDVNFYGYLHCVKAAYKSLCESNGSLIAVTSFSGEVGLPYRTAYCASKFAVVSRGVCIGSSLRSLALLLCLTLVCSSLSCPVRQTGFLESLRSEMSVTSPAHSFHITIVCPPTVNTNLRRNALTPDPTLKEAPSAHAMTVADCAAAIVDAGDRKLRKAFFPFNSWVASYLRPLIPDAMDKLIMKRAKL
jgi:short-subunit dehydrogenase